MEAPDKIYLREEDFARIYTQPSSIIDNDIEYIRKDALLEWLQEARAVPHDGAIWRDGAFMEVITKINTM